MAKQVAALSHCIHNLSSLLTAFSVTVYLDAGHGIQDF
jgi:hypothetical protein